MGFRNWLIKTLGGYTFVEVDKIKNDIIEKYSSLERKQDRFLINKSMLPIHTLSAETVIPESEKEYIVREYVEEELARTLGETLYHGGYIEFDEDNEVYRETTGSAVVRATVRVAKR